jgi:hypothetical protein
MLQTHSTTFPSEATFCVGSDRYGGTIIKVYHNKKGEITAFDWQQDYYKLVNGSAMSERQVYQYEPNPDATVIHVTKRKNNRWVQKGESSKSSGFCLGMKQTYQDPSF